MICFQLTIFAQMEEDVGPVILINKFSVDPNEFDQFLKGWAKEAEKFKEQPGFISTQLHKGIGGSGIFINYAVWESAAHFKRAVNKVMDPQDRMSAYPPRHLLIYSRKWLFQEYVLTEYYQLYFLK
jgi:quinol monooxygenase YgiN